MRGVEAYFHVFSTFANGWCVLNTHIDAHRLNTRLEKMPSSIIRGSIHPLPPYVNWISTGTTLPFTLLFSFPNMFPGTGLQASGRMRFAGRLLTTLVVNQEHPLLRSQAEIILLLPWRVKVGLCWGNQLWLFRFCYSRSWHRVVWFRGTHCLLLQYKYKGEH
jgi:hypothetical protein